MTMKTKAEVNKTKSNSKVSNVYLHNQSVIRIAIMTAAAMVLLYARWAVMGGKPEFKPIDNPAAYSNSLFTKVATYNYIYFLNLLLLVWPQWLCYDWSMGCVPLIENILDYRILCVLAMYLYGMLATLAVFNTRNNGSTKRFILLALALVIIPFLPAANIFYPVGFVVAERILYIPSAGHCLLVAFGLDRLAGVGRGTRYKICLGLFAIVTLVYGLRSWQRSLEWRQEYPLFVSGLAVCPLNAKVHYNVAKVADAANQADWAIEEYREAIRLYPEYYQAMNNLANLLKNQKNYSEAEYHLRKAISLKEQFPAAWMNLGIVLAGTARAPAARRAYLRALRLRPRYPDCLYNLANLYLEMNNTREAKENWLKAINMNPTHVLAWTNLLALLDNTGQLEQALELIPQALSALPTAPTIHFAVANIHGKLERYEQAEHHFKQAIELFGDAAKAIHYANLGVLYHRWKKYGLAKDMYRKALEIDPSFKSAQKNLMSLQ